MSAEPLSQQQQQQQQQAMEVFDFEGVDFVRLRSGCAYLHAADDGRSVRLDRRRESHHAVWAVTPLVYSEGSIPCVLLRGVYGRYLGAADATPRGSLCLSPCLAAKQRDYDWQEVPAIMWRAVATRRQGAFRLQDATGCYLRRCLLSGLYVSDGGSLCTATKWAVERVPRAGRPDPPIPPPEVSSSSPAFLDFVFWSMCFLSPSSVWRNSLAPFLARNFNIEIPLNFCSYISYRTGRNESELARVQESINRSIIFCNHIC